METFTRGIVTPEAVVLEFDTAGVASRILARLVDLAVLVVVAYLIGVVVSVVIVSVPEAAFVAGIVSVAVLLLGYPVVLESFGGRTVGKMALGLRVVTTEGAPSGFRHAALRGLTGLVEVYGTLGSIAAATALSTQRNQRFGDLAAGTMVVRDRIPGARTLAVAFPPPAGCETYVASLDVSAVSDAEYGVIRSFLLRVFELTPGARASLAVRLANPTSVRMHHTPPEWMGPEVFLACVASAYQLRHGGHLLPTWPAPPVSAPTWGPPPAGPGDRPPPPGPGDRPPPPGTTHLPPPPGTTHLPPPPVTGAGTGGSPPLPPPPSVPGVRTGGWGPPSDPAEGFDRRADRAARRTGR